MLKHCKPGTCKPGYLCKRKTQKCEPKKTKALLPSATNSYPKLTMPLSPIASHSSPKLTKKWLIKMGLRPNSINKTVKKNIKPYKMSEKQYNVMVKRYENDLNEFNQHGYREIYDVFKKIAKRQYSKDVAFAKYQETFYQNFMNTKNPYRTDDMYKLKNLRIKADKTK